MELKELLAKYNKNVILSSFLAKALSHPNDYVEIEKVSTGYEATPKELFYSEVGSSNIKISLDSKLHFTGGSCGCLQFYKQHECIHTTALIALAIKVISPSRFDKEYNSFSKDIISEKNNIMINNLSRQLKRSNPYFNSVHLIPIIEEINNEFFLSVKIGYDKDYVIKDIPLFIHLVENNEEYTYGQKLTFVHSYECLDEISKELYIFLTNICNDSIKKIKIRKSNLLKVLEFYNDQYIYLKLENEPNFSLRKIDSSANIKVVLEHDRMHFTAEQPISTFVNGINNAYFISQDTILAYQYKSRQEEKIFNALFKNKGELVIEYNSDDFIINLLPIIRNDITITDEFYDKYPIPDIKINSYLSYAEGSILLNCKIKCQELDKKSPYIREMLNGYFKVVEGKNFKRNANKVYCISDIENQYRFLTGDLSSIKSFGEIYFDDSMKNIKAKKSTRTGIKVSYDVGLLDFTFTNSEFSIADIQQMLRAYHEKKNFIKLKDNSILELDNESLKEIDDFIEDFNISINDLDKKIRKPLNYLLKLINGADRNVDTDEKIQSLLNELSGYADSNFLPPEDLLPSLRNYQIDGYKWLSSLAKYNFGGILADDMGLGKTLEIISFIKADTKQMPSLIVCPMSLVYNWENECYKWNVNCDVKVVLGTVEEREALVTNIDDNKKALYITSYDSLRRDIDNYKAKFRFVVADEAQYIKNQFALKSEAVKTLKSEVNFALTGTPIENGLADLWSIFDFIIPGYLPAYNSFKSRYEALIVHDDKEALDKLKLRVKPFILRRTKKDVLSDLPEKIEEYYYVKMQPKQKEIYDAYITKLKDDIQNQGGNNILGLLTRLRQICITPELIYQEAFENTKIELALDLIKSSIDAGHRILVFSQFAQVFPIVSKQLELMGIKHFILNGQTKSDARIEMVNQFNENEEIKVFLISLKAGGTGLNLVGADMVIHLDPWWNSSAEAQATDRAYRIGQNKNVYVLKLICKDTIEEKVVNLQKAKSTLAESIFDFDSKAKYSKDAILKLIE